MWLSGRDRKTIRRHVPDFLLTASDGRLTVVDVKPAEFLSRPKAAVGFAWTRQVRETAGWRYEVWLGDDPQRWANIKALGATRRLQMFESQDVREFDGAGGISFGDRYRARPWASDVDLGEQLVLVRRLPHEPDNASGEDHAAACLTLLYAQLVAKIVRLTVDDIRTRDGETYLRVGPEPLLLIPPLDELATALPADKPISAASRLADFRWLFIGKSAGTHLHPASLMRRMHLVGMTFRASRNTALLHCCTSPPTEFVPDRYCQDRIVFSNGVVGRPISRERSPEVAAWVSSRMPWRTPRWALLRIPIDPGLRPPMSAAAVLRWWSASKGGR